MKSVILLVLASVLGVQPKAPYIAKQSTDMITYSYQSPTWERHIWIKNPLNYAVWAYIECEHHLTVNPVGLRGRGTTEIVLPDIPPQEQCLLHHWYKQDGTKSPKPWSP